MATSNSTSRKNCASGAGREPQTRENNTSTPTGPGREETERTCPCMMTRNPAGDPVVSCSCSLDFTREHDNAQGTQPHRLAIVPIRVSVHKILGVAATVWRERLRTQVPPAVMPERRRPRTKIEQGGPSQRAAERCPPVRSCPPVRPEVEVVKVVPYLARTQNPREPEVTKDLKCPLRRRGSAYNSTL